MSNTPTLEQKIAFLENARDVQCSAGNWDYSPYSLGYANGIILALAILKDEEPQFLKFLNAPLCWLEDRPAIEKTPSRGDQRSMSDPHFLAKKDSEMKFYTITPAVMASTGPAAHAEVGECVGCHRVVMAVGLHREYLCQECLDFITDWESDFETISPTTTEGES